jgi:hypothetical protein
MEGIRRTGRSRVYQHEGARDTNCATQSHHWSKASLPNEGGRHLLPVEHQAGAEGSHGGASQPVRWPSIPNDSGNVTAYFSIYERRGGRGGSYGSLSMSCVVLARLYSLRSRQRQLHTGYSPLGTLSGTTCWPLVSCVDVAMVSWVGGLMLLVLLRGAAR